VHSRVHWVEPKLVAEINYLSWTGDGLLCHTVFVGQLMGPELLRKLADSDGTRDQGLSLTKVLRVCVRHPIRKCAAGNARICASRSDAEHPGVARKAAIRASARVSCATASANAEPATDRCAALPQRRAAFSISPASVQWRAGDFGRRLARVTFNHAAAQKPQHSGRSTKCTAPPKTSGSS
jgi:hypothetical protein